VIAADFLLVALAPGRSTVAMLALGNTIGLTAAGVALLVAVRRACGPAALAGAGRAAVSGLAAATAGAGAGSAVAAALPTAGPPVLIAALALLVALAAFAGAAFLLDSGELRAAASRVWRVVP
jgi:putative peptidoglycan lipid II flippase